MIYSHTHCRVKAAPRTPHADPGNGSRQVFDVDLAAFSCAAMAAIASVTAMRVAP
jgi:hypothetical protein